MRLYIFKSGVNSKLYAFAGDLSGDKLPEQFRPWHVVGVVAAENDPPHRLPRGDIERAINDHGFQLWRRRPKKKQA
jgi:hypothetical protein